MTRGFFLGGCLEAQRKRYDGFSSGGFDIFPSVSPLDCTEASIDTCMKVGCIDG